MSAQLLTASPFFLGACQNKTDSLCLYIVSLNILQRRGEASFLLDQMKDRRVETLRSGGISTSTKVVLMYCTAVVTVETPETHRHITNVEIQ